MQGIYQIKNVVNGKIYVGSSINMDSRWSNHKTALRGNYHHGTYLQRAWGKYGEDNFLFSIVEEMPFSEDATLREVENYYFNKLKPEYNEAKYATRSPWYKRHFPKEMKEKMRKSKTGDKHWNYGKHHSEETRAKISASHVGKRIPKDVRERMGSKGEKNPKSKLTERDVFFIKYFKRKCNVPSKKIAAYYKVHESTIHNAISGRTWKHLLENE